MVAEYNNNAASAGVSQKVVGYQADLLSEPTIKDSPDWTNLDMLVISMALHHFEFPDQALQKLGARLKKGGVLFIIDLVPEPGHFKGHDNHHHHHHSADSQGEDDQKHKHEFGEAAHTVKTHGFSQDDLQNLFQGAGFGSQTGYQVLPTPLEFTKDDKIFSKTVFIARAQRA